MLQIECIILIQWTRECCPQKSIKQIWKQLDLAHSPATCSGPTVPRPSRATILSKDDITSATAGAAGAAGVRAEVARIPDAPGVPGVLAVDVVDEDFVPAGGVDAEAEAARVPGG